MNKLFITNDDKCLYQKRYNLVGSSVLIMLTYVITKYFYKNYLISLGYQDFYFYLQY